MIKFILKRLGISFLVLLGGSLLMFYLTVSSGDPLQDYYESNDPNRDQIIASITQRLMLDQPWIARYWDWLTGVAGCIGPGVCDLGQNINGVEVGSLLGNAAVSTLRLVTLATVLAILVGITVGIVTAIRQYSGFDYVVTFLTFLFFSLPVFWAAVLLKEFGAIRYNDWIADPQISSVQAIVIGVVLAVILQAVLGGSWRRRLVTAGVTAVFVFAALTYFTSVGWWRAPALGIGIVAVVAIAAAVGLTAIFAGLGNRRVLYSTLTTVGVGLVAYYAVGPLLAEPNLLILLLLLAITIVVSLASGYFWGGYSSRRTAMGLSAVTGVIMGLLILLDRIVYAWAGFLGLKSRPISTIGSNTPNFRGDYWETILDNGTQLLLPTVLLTLISIASYSRYTRASMLETMNQDFVRTARSKGLSERVVIVKHAFRNALIPITTIVAFDFAALIGGAVITETVFGWKGMGELFRTGLDAVDPAPVMAFFLVTGLAAIVMNMLADIAYAFLDPRIRR
ncbi:ABC transporter permease [Serinibacter arcticus]|uniref:Oligopeptide transport system permease protein OppB n=1 Tax=Serinibacter arcticus TaxID=1655435 RepID=A0A4Z1DX59_9MICO|nr:ABC transporter permease [Serinibacter arcticus]TGO04134.1 Oligopeptide transport system permease protein OppB [Serinibacter arcticus]